MDASVKVKSRVHTGWVYWSTVVERASACSAETMGLRTGRSACLPTTRFGRMRAHHPRTAPDLALQRASNIWPATEPRTRDLC